VAEEPLPCDPQPNNEASNENKSPWERVLLKYRELDARLKVLEEATQNSQSFDTSARDDGVNADNPKGSR